MAIKQSHNDQLDFFTELTHERTPRIRPDGGNPLAGSLPADGARPGNGGPLAGSLVGSAGAYGDRNGSTPARLSQAGADARTGAGEIHSASVGAELISQFNGRNYRPSEADQVGVGSLKQKYRQNVAAVERLRLIEAEQRPATAEDKGILVRYVGWGGMPQVFADEKEAPQWAVEANPCRDKNPVENAEGGAGKMGPNISPPVRLRSARSVALRPRIAV